jgi:hypothetical protein
LGAGLGGKQGKQACLPDAADAVHVVDERPRGFEHLREER